MQPDLISFAIILKSLYAPFRFLWVGNGRDWSFASFLTACLPFQNCEFRLRMHISCLMSMPSQRQHYMNPCSDLRTPSFLCKNTCKCPCVGSPAPDFDRLQHISQTVKNSAYLRGVLLKPEISQKHKMSRGHYKKEKMRGTIIHYIL